MSLSSFFVIDKADMIKYVNIQALFADSFDNEYWYMAYKKKRNDDREIQNISWLLMDPDGAFRLSMVPIDNNTAGFFGFKWNLLRKMTLKTQTM